MTQKIFDKFEEDEPFYLIINDSSKEKIPKKDMCFAAIHIKRETDNDS
jgi:hypothetical protein